jgi:ribosomal protein S18 acetylase RimI-like enzyme
MVGFMQLEKKSIEKYILEKFTVLPEYRHYGYGKSLLDFACNKAKELGGKKILIGIIEDNKVLKQWYITNGFIHVGTRNFDSLPFTVGFMEKEINL